MKRTFLQARITAVRKVGNTRRATQAMIPKKIPFLSLPPAKGKGTLQPRHLNGTETAFWCNGIEE
jgi:hypothetical protein